MGVSLKIGSLCALGAHLSSALDMPSRAGARAPLEGGNDHALA